MATKQCIFTPEKQVIPLTITGDIRQVFAEPRTILLHVLQENLGLTDINENHGTRECGACTVLADGTPVASSCLTLAIEARGKGIVTIEALKAIVAAAHAT